MNETDQQDGPGVPTEPPAALPEGSATRPLTLADVRAVYEVMAAQELHDIGTVEIAEDDIAGDWQRPSHDLGASSVGVTADGRLVAYAELIGPDRYDAAVHPDHRGRGIGTFLARWIRDLARSRGSHEVGMPVPEASPGDLLLASLGYRARWTSWVLELPAGAEVARRDLPAGYVVRGSQESDWAGAYAVQEDAFLEWSARERETYEDWAARVVRRPGFEPWHLRVVTDAAGEVVAMAYVTGAAQGEAYVDRLATRPDQRGMGLAQALLVDAFAVAREHGATSSRLSTDSRTGALGLYEKVGMRVASTWVNRAVTL